MQRSSRKSGCLFNFTLLLSLLLILLGVSVMVVWVCVLIYFVGSFQLSLPVKNAAPSLELLFKNAAPSLEFDFWLIDWIGTHLLPGLSLLILGYIIPKHLPKRRHRILVYGLAWLVMALSTVRAIMLNLAMLLIALGVFPAQG